jgi:hypothetical protein
MDARRLVAWTALQRRRRRRSWWERTVVPVAALAVAAVIELILVQRGVASAVTTWLAFALLGFAIGAVGVAQGMFWRDDTPMLARLPLSGGTLFAAAVREAARSTATLAVVAVVVALPLWWRLPQLVLPSVSLIVALAAAASCLIPSCCAGAALLVASGSAERLGRALGGEFRAPVTTWLGLLPGVATAAVVLAALAAEPWLIGEARPSAPGLWLMITVVVLSLASVMLARGGRSSLALAMREVAALDRQRFAHIEVHPPRGLEPVVLRRLPTAARPIYAKDARLMRRRFPLAWVVGTCLWLGAGLGWLRGSVLMTMLPGVSGCAYLVLLSLRLSRPPVEVPVSLSCLPSPREAVRLAKRRWLQVWALVFTVPAAVVAWVLDPVMGAVLSALIIAALGLGGRILTRAWPGSP